MKVNLSRSCARCGGNASWLVTGSRHSGAPGRLLVYCDECRYGAHDALALTVPLTVFDRDPETFLEHFYASGATQSSPDYVAQQLGLQPKGGWYEEAKRSSE